MARPSKWLAERERMKSAIDEVTNVINGHRAEARHALDQAGDSQRAIAHTLLAISMQAERARADEALRRFDDAL